MASMALRPVLTKFHRARAIVLQYPPTCRVFVSVRPIQASSGHDSSTTKQTADEAKKAGQDVKNKAASTAEDVTQKTKDVAGKVADTAQDLTEKAKQTAQEAWGSVKDTTQKIKDTVVGKAEESKEAVKESADNVKRGMNEK